MAYRQIAVTTTTALTLLCAVTLHGCGDCSFGESRQCYLDGQTEAKEECKRLANDVAQEGQKAYEKGYEDGYKSGFKHRGHSYTWLVWLRDLIMEFMFIIAAVLTIGLLIGHFKVADSETAGGSRGITESGSPRDGWLCVWSWRG
ncbi:unnamed protein product [Durusdinium trenchii]|uniref:Uncharacterized protein n=1 Tax=Durusdinium trenchii TaxID=1381693 RepID=A0ABP0IY97_9DINO